HFSTARECKGRHVGLMALKLADWLGGGHVPKDDRSTRSALDQKPAVRRNGYLSLQGTTPREFRKSMEYGGHQVVDWCWLALRRGVGGISTALLSGGGIVRARYAVAAIHEQRTPVRCERHRAPGKLLRQSNRREFATGSHVP